MNILDTDIDTLKKDQLKALKDHVCSVLDDIKALFCAERYQEIVEKYVKFSPAGDGYGDDNCFINFHWNREEERADISEVLEMASKLSGKKIDLSDI